MTSWILATALMALAFLPSSATAQSKDTLVGTWKLVDATDTTEKGEVIEHSYGQNPTGFLTYTPVPPLADTCHNPSLWWANTIVLLGPQLAPKIAGVLQNRDRGPAADGHLLQLALLPETQPQAVG
jgi:hypothetical protein